MYKATLSFTTKDYDVRKNQILADDFTTQDEIDEFLEIGYIVVYDDTLEITQNGLYDVKEYEKADVDVPSSEPTLQSKSVTITSNTTTTINPDSNYDGLSSVSVTTNVAGALKVPDTMKFQGSGFTSLPTGLDFSETTNFKNMFRSVLSLVDVTGFNTSSATIFEQCFYSCSKLETVPILDLSKATTLYDSFYNCFKLTNDSLNNIMASCIGATSYRGTKTLAMLGIPSTLRDVAQTLPKYTDFVASGWSAS